MVWYDSNDFRSGLGLCGIDFRQRPYALFKYSILPLPVVLL